MKLIEIVQPTEHLTPNDIKWLDQCVKDTITNFGTINRYWRVNPITGLIDITGNVLIPSNTNQLWNGLALPFRIGTITGRFHSWQQLGSFENMPSIITSSCVLYDTSLQGLSKYLKEVEHLYVSSKLESHLFNVLFINVKDVKVIGSPKSLESFDVLKAVDIINKCLRGEISKIMCQKELVQAGLGEFARM